MAKRIFFDANIIIELVNADNEFNKPVSWLVSRLMEQKDVLLCSPVSFAITYYFLGKKFRNKTFLNEKTRQVFSLFSFTNESEEMMKRVFQSTFLDLEDALQYYSALDAKAEVIITNNYSDFFNSSIPVYHPLQYYQEFLL